MFKKIAITLMLIASALNANSAVLEVSSPGSNIGVGTTSTSNALSVKGAVAIGTSAYTSKTASSNGMIIEGNVGIGTWNPTSNLHVVGSIGATTVTSSFIGNLIGDVTGNVSGSSGSTTGNAATATALIADPNGCPPGEFANDIAANGTLTCTTPAGSSGGWTDSGATVNPTTSTDAVGIGTTSAIGRMTIKGQNTHYLGCGDSISAAVTSAVSGDKIILGACTYTISASTTINKALTIEGQGETSTTLDSGATSTGFFSITSSNVTLSNLKITGTNVPTAITASGSSSINNINYKNLIIDISRSSAGSYGITNINASGVADNLRIFNSTGDGTGGDQNRSFSVFGNSTCSEDVLFYVNNVFAYSKSTSSSWDGGRMRAFMLWNNSADRCEYDMTLYLSNSVGLAEVPNGTASYGTEAINCQGPNAARNYGVTGGHYCYIYNTILDGGLAHVSRTGGTRDMRCDDYANCYLENVTLRRHNIQNQNSAVIYKRGVINAAGVVSAYSENADILTGGAPGIYTLAQNAGNETQAGVRTGFTGGYNLLQGGTGSSATGTDAAKTGGSGGYGSIVGGAGGVQSSAAPSNTGGTGGSVRLTGGIGGDASGGTTNAGGNGGSVYIRGGIPGAGTESNGLAGNIFLGSDINGLLYGKVGIGTASTPGSKLSVFGGTSIGSSTYYQTASPSNGLIVSGNVGIATINPTANLHVAGSARITGLVSCDTIDTDSSGNLSCGTDDTSAGGSVVWTDGGTHIYTTATTDQVEIGSTVPFSGSKLTVKGGSGIGDTDYIAAFIQNGVTPETGVASIAPKTLAIQGSGGAYYSARDVTNDIELLYGISTLGVGFMGSSTAHDMQIRTNSLSRITISSGGNVGIGTTIPAAQFSVKSPASDGNTQTFTQLPAASATPMTLLDEPSAGKPRLRMRDSAAPSSILAQVDTNGNSFVNVGNFGVGTFNPSGKLHVLGGDLLVGLSSGFGNASAGNDLYVSGNAEVDGTLFGSAAQFSGNVGINSTNPRGSLDVGPTGTIYAQTLNGGGSDALGIGTTLPDSLLTVAASGYFQSKITSAGAPTSADCDADAERGRFIIDTTNNRLYVCNGASRGWDYVGLTD